MLTPLERIEEASIVMMRQMHDLATAAQTLCAMDTRGNPALAAQRDRLLVQVGLHAGLAAMKAQAMDAAVSGPAGEEFWYTLWIKAGERNEARTKAMQDLALSDPATATAVMDRLAKLRAEAGNVARATRSVPDRLHQIGNAALLITDAVIAHSAR